MLSPCSVDDRVLLLPTTAPPAQLQRTPLISPPLGQMTALNPPSSRFTLSIPLLGRTYDGAVGGCACAFFVRFLICVGAFVERGEADDRGGFFWFSGFLFIFSLVSFCAISVSFPFVFVLLIYLSFCRAFIVSFILAFISAGVLHLATVSVNPPLFHFVWSSFVVRGFRLQFSSPGLV